MIRLEGIGPGRFAQAEQRWPSEGVAESLTGICLPQAGKIKKFLARKGRPDFIGTRVNPSIIYLIISSLRKVYNFNFKLLMNNLG
jgi:hypothetical protein